MPLYRVERTVVAIVEAPDYRSALNAPFRSEWEPAYSVGPVHTLSDVPDEWEDYPPIDPKGNDVGATLRVRLTAKESP